MLVIFFVLLFFRIIGFRGEGVDIEVRSFIGKRGIRWIEIIYVVRLY